MQTSETESALNEALAEAGLAFHELAVSAPLVALPSSHPFVNAKSLTLEQLADFPYVYFDQGEDAPIAFYEEALSQVPRAKKVACTDRASLTELIMAINGYTVTSGILVGISDGAASTPCRSTPTCSCASATWCVRAKSLARSASASWTPSRRTS